MKAACLYPAFAACMLLAACSGKESALEFSVDADRVRILTGGEAPPVSDEDVVPTLENVLGAANLRNASNYIVNYSAPRPVEEAPPALVPMDCTEDACPRYRYVNPEPVTQDLSSLTFSSVDSEYRGVATHAGATLVQGAAVTPDPDDPKASWNHSEYGGWLDHSAFFGQHSLRLDGESGMETLNYSLGYSFGYATGENPVAVDATWKGVMVGVDGLRDGTRGLFIQGDATILVDGSVADMTADIAFTNIHDLTTGGHRDDMIWSGVPVAEGSFRTGMAGDSVQGTFYGPDQEEVGGVFERDSYVGSFGARRH